MSSEKELKSEGEELAKSAVDFRLAAKHLRTIYALTKTKPLPMVEAFIQHQLGRPHVSGAEALERTLQLFRKYEEDRTKLAKVLMYANMLYPYYERQIGLEYQSIAEECAKRICELQGCRYLGADVSSERDQVIISVRVSGLRRDPKSLAFDIRREIISRDPKFNGRIWIDQQDRR